MVLNHNNTISFLLAPDSHSPELPCLHRQLGGVAYISLAILVTCISFPSAPRFLLWVSGGRMA